MINHDKSIATIGEWFNIAPEDYKILKSYVDYGPGMDEECISLCDAMNAVNGIVTSESCSGHGREGLQVWFKTTSFKGLFFVTRCIDKRYFKHDWNYTVSVGDMIIDGILPISFLISSNSVGEAAYKEAEDLAINMSFHLNHKNFMKAFGLDVDDFEWECNGGKNERN